MLVPWGVKIEKVKHSVLEEGGSEKVTFLKQLLHFFGPSDGGEW